MKNHQLKRILKVKTCTAMKMVRYVCDWASKNQRPIITGSIIWAICMPGQSLRTNSMWLFNSWYARFSFYNWPLKFKQLWTKCSFLIDWVTLVCGLLIPCYLLTSHCQNKYFSLIHEWIRCQTMLSRCITIWIFFAKCVCVCVSLCALF